MLHIAYNAMLLRTPYSGVEYAILDLMEALSFHGTHRYTFIVPEHAELPDSISKRKHSRISFEYVRVPMRSRCMRLLWEQLFLAARARELGAGLLHAPGYLAPLHSDLPVVLTVYDIEAIYNPRYCRMSNRLNYAFFLPRSIARAQAIVTPSAATREQVAKRFPGCISRLRSIPLAVHDQFFKPVSETQRSTVRRYYGLPRSYVLFVGNQEPRKNLATLFEAMNRIRHRKRSAISLVLAGSDGRASRKLREEILQLGASGMLINIGYVPRAHLPALYEGAEALVFPSWDEGFGLPPLEAMAVGCPVVCSDAGALAETAPYAAPFSPDNVNGLIDQLTRVIDDAEYRAKLIQAGRRHVTGFRWHTVACRLEQLYEQVCPLA